MAQVGLPQECGSLSGVTIVRESIRNFASQIGLDLLEIGCRHAVDVAPNGSKRGMFDIRCQHTNGTEDARHRWNHYAGNTELAGEVRRMHAAITAESHQGEIARIAPALHRHGTNGARHRRVRDSTDTMCGIP